MVRHQKIQVAYDSNSRFLVYSVMIRTLPFFFGRDLSVRLLYNDNESRVSPGKLVPLLPNWGMTGTQAAWFSCVPPCERHCGFHYCMMELFAGTDFVICLDPGKK